MAAWNIERSRPLRHRLAIVTGATSGLGLRTAFALAGAGAQVILADRSAEKGAAALARIRAVHPLAQVSFERLDLASLACVRDFSERMAWEHSRIDLLVNHGGAPALSRRRITRDGYEMQLAANHLGPFALTLRLLPRLLAAPAARVVTVSSLAHRCARIAFDDLQTERHYGAWTAHGQSGLAALLFALELDRRARAQGWALRSHAVHPGFAPTGDKGRGEPNLAHTLEEGARPVIFAATSPEAQGGMVYGPGGVEPHALDRATAARLWAVSEGLTGVSVKPFRPADYAVSPGGTEPGRGSTGTSLSSPLACSKSAAAWSATSSRRGGATTWRPTGRPY